MGVLDLVIGGLVTQTELNVVRQLRLLPRNRRSTSFSKYSLSPVPLSVSPLSQAHRPAARRMPKKSALPSEVRPSQMAKAIPDCSERVCN